MIAACLAAAAGCGAASSAPPAVPTAAPLVVSQTTLADEDAYRPTYSRPELQKLLSTERGTQLTLEHQISELDAKDPAAAVDEQLRVMRADLAVRRRFIAMLEACEATGRQCPPRLDDPPWVFDPDAEPPAEPPMVATLRFDLDSWRALAAELHGRACACRTIACVDSVGVAVDNLEARPVPQVRGDDAATISITRARECLFRLRGKTVTRLAGPSVAPVD